MWTSLWGAVTVKAAWSACSRSVSMTPEEDAEHLHEHRSSEILCRL